MTEPVRATVTVPTSQERAFTAFVHEFATWWPSAYTWAGEVLDTIAIEGQIGGLCYEGGDEKAQQCGWLKDRFGLSWQVIPRPLFDMLNDGDAERAARVTEAMLAMKKLDLAELERAYDG